MSDKHFKGDLGINAEPPKSKTSRIALFILALTAITTYALFYHEPLAYLSHKFSCSSSMSTSPYTGWHSRARDYTSRFDLSQHDLAFADIRSTPVNPQGLTAGFFYPDIVIDAQGQVLKLDEKDWRGIVALATRAVTELPETGGFRNQWRVAHDFTSQPIDWVRVKVPGGSFKDVSVYGFDMSKDTLEEPIGAYTALPPILKELFGLLAEGRNGYKSGTEDKEILSIVESALALDA